MSVSVPEFYEIYSLTFKFIKDKFGNDSLIKYLEDIAKNYFKYLTDDIKKRGTEAIKDYWLESCNNDDIEFNYKIDKNQFLLKVKKCSALKWIRDHNGQEFDNYCMHCKVINSKIAELSGFEYIINSDQKNMLCEHQFIKK